MKDIYINTNLLLYFPHQQATSRNKVVMNTEVSRIMKGFINGLVLFFENFNSLNVSVFFGLTEYISMKQITYGSVSRFNGIRYWKIQQKVTTCVSSS